MTPNARKNLVRILQNAHAGELAAAYAYRGHWKSVRNESEKEQIRKIEAEEWEHRECVRKWLEELGAAPRRIREGVFWTIGRTLGLACFASGWFLPMYFAGRLESQNVQEYVDAAGFARELGMNECFDDMMKMSRTEGEHEEFFRAVVAGHKYLPTARRLFGWS